VTDTTSDPRTARTERIVLVIGLLITYGVTVFWSLVLSVLMVLALVNVLRGQGA